MITNSAYMDNFLTQFMIILSRLSITVHMDYFLTQEMILLSRHSATVHVDNAHSQQEFDKCACLITIISKNSYKIAMSTMLIKTNNNGRLQWLLHSNGVYISTTYIKISGHTDM